MEMKKILNFIDQNSNTILKWVLTVGITIIVYEFLHRLGTAERGYDAIGGEIAALFIPLFVILAPKIKASIKEMIDLCKEDE